MVENGRVRHVAVEPLLGDERVDALIPVDDAHLRYEQARQDDRQRNRNQERHGACPPAQPFMTSGGRKLGVALIQRQRGW